jgi:hypothetical protein
MQRGVEAIKTKGGFRSSFERKHGADERTGREGVEFSRGVKPRFEGFNPGKRRPEGFILSLGGTLRWVMA